MKKISGFQITAKGEVQLSKFYSDSFGWKQSAGSHEHVMDIDTGNVKLESSIMGRGDFIPDYVSLIIECENIEETIEKCCRNGATLVRPKFEINGTQLAIIEDPDGHVITFQRQRAKVP